MHHLSLSTVFFLVTLAVQAQDVGLSLGCLKKQLMTNAPETLQKVKEMGFKQVEFSSTYGLTFPEFIKLLAVNNLTVAGFETDLERLEKFPQSAVDEARSYGARYLVCKYPASSTKFTVEEADRVAATLNTAGKIVSRNGLLLCYQPSGIEFQPGSKGTLFDYLVQKLDIRFVHLQLNVFSVKQAGQEPVLLLKKYPTRFIMVDLNDRKKGSPVSLDGKASEEFYVTLGKGDAGIAEVVKAAKELGIQQFFIDDQSPKAEQQIPKSLQYLKSLN
jgi:sugar phosphate isomerase/epimerase